MTSSITAILLLFMHQWIDKGLAECCTPPPTHTDFLWGLVKLQSFGSCGQKVQDNFTHTCTILMGMIGSLFSAEMLGWPSSCLSPCSFKAPLSPHLLSRLFLYVVPPAGQADLMHITQGLEEYKSRSHRNFLRLSSTLAVCPFCCTSHVKVSHRARFIMGGAHTKA